ncbi:MAG: hypothetical protein A2068_07250 [Ignavibacteria bacterium GWB2_35_6b]|nr:MAG: hypothetical protein A2068_07250 [Ignavibacteria bacterium GWB2_35_6b]
MKILITGGSGFIGTNLIEKLLLREDKILNLDIRQPKIHSHFAYWQKCNLMNYDELEKIVKGFGPEHLIHFAARTDVEGKHIDDYSINIIGTKNLINALIITDVKRVIFTSTQFVHQNHGTLLNDDDYAPHTIYGESKVEMEKLIKKSDVSFCWTIIRPTNIWGPWHPRYPYEFWKVLAEGKYFHPDAQNVFRSYGYVGNVVWQIEKILELPEEKVNKKVLYVGDRPIELYDWVNGFSNALIRKDVRKVPKSLVKSLALFGDLLKSVKIPFPITSSRYKSMTSSNPVQMDKTFELLGDPSYTLKEGIAETVDWFKIHFPKLIKS